MDEMMNAEVSENGVYELGFLLSAAVSEDKLPEAFGTLKAMITDRGAIEIGEEFPKMMQLAYTMEKTVANKIERHTEGYFGWIKFELPASEVQALDAALRAKNDIIRFLLISTVRENTIASKRGFGIRRKPKSTGGDSNEAAPVLSKEEIDREIEALVDDKAEVA